MNEVVHQMGGFVAGFNKHAIHVTEKFKQHDKILAVFTNRAQRRSG